MKTLNVIVEHLEDYLSAYIIDIPIAVVGSNISEIKKKINEAIKLHLKSGKKPINLSKGEYELIYQFEIRSLLNHYSRLFSFVVLQYLTGINQKQLCYYASGLKKPNEQQKKKIESALHNLGNELLSIHL